MAKWRVALTAFTMLVAGLVPPAFAQTWTPNLDLVAGTTVHVTHDQTFDYGSHPPDASIGVQLHNGPNPECVFTARRSDTGASQYQNIGGSNGYDSSGNYRDPPRVLLSLPIPIVWTLTLACGPPGTLKVTISTEAPPPPPPPTPSPTVGPSTPAVAHPPTPAGVPKPPSLKPTQPPLQNGVGNRTTTGQASRAVPALVPAATPIVDETPTALPPVAAPSPSPSPSPSRSPSPAHLGAAHGPGGHGPNLLRFLIIAFGAVVLVIAILYAFGLRWVRVDEEAE